MDIANQLSKAIKEAKWLEISYDNMQGDTTQYWIAVKDINPKTKKLKVKMFNHSKSSETIDSEISFDRIRSAAILDLSTYEDSELLAQRIEADPAAYQWLHYDRFNYNVLNYYAECNVLDSDPSQKESTLIDGIDLAALRENKLYQLDKGQMEQIVSKIYHYDLKKAENSHYTLAINCFSIDSGNSKFVIAYYVVSFDPSRRSLVLDRRVSFNKSFLIDGRRHALFNYVRMDVDKFIESFEEKYHESVAIVNENLRPGEIINTRPDMMILQREVSVNLSDTYEIIERKHNEGNLPIPLRSFFGNNKKSTRRKEPSLIICDKRININQMRVLYNSMKHPVTYVQGPPGTGKTQTIINVVLSAFYNEKTTLVCSSNNKPVDGIVEKLVFSHNGESINFPYLRLGNIDDVKKATARILELYNYVRSTPKRSDEDKLKNIKKVSDGKNAELIKLLSIQEKRVKCEDGINSINRLLKLTSNEGNSFTDHLKGFKDELTAELASLPEISNERITDLFSPLQENRRLSQYLFFRSLGHIEKLKREKYKPLIEICRITDADQRATEFNEWLHDNDNMKLLADAFPVIFSTNISSRRLGTPEFLFDLVIMDEAGQCNVATALIPIARASSLLLVGDPNQLKPVVTLEDSVNDELMSKYNVHERYNYKNHSIFDVMHENDSVSEFILLKYHYRCGKKIIGFSNQRYYNNDLNLSAVSNVGELELLNVKSINSKQKNQAYEEAVAIVDYVKRNNYEDIYIVTPFVSQKELINSLLRKNGIDNVECGTVHSAQGAERDTIILATALSTKTKKRTFDWLKNNQELINVAVTRAKNKLIVSSDVEMLEILSQDKSDDLYNLVEYVKHNGNVSVPKSATTSISIGSSNGSQAEDEFYKTVAHFCTCHKTFEVERNVKLSKLFASEPEFANSKKEFDLVLYEVGGFYGKRPSVVFEVNGGEHFGMVERERSDRAKKDICQKHGIRLVIIPNSFVKSYEDLIPLIIASKNSNIPIQQTLFD